MRFIGVFLGGFLIGVYILALLFTWVKRPLLHKSSLSLRVIYLIIVAGIPMLGAILGFVAVSVYSLYSFKVIAFNDFEHTDHNIWNETITLRYALLTILIVAVSAFAAHVVIHASQRIWEKYYDPYIT